MAYFGCALVAWRNMFGTVAYIYKVSGSNIEVDIRCSGKLFVSEKTCICSLKYIICYCFALTSSTYM